mmetsp:Transcript_79156/g.223829  ORF Transcript_79156/g.223829 Transcript_79156/m.223829 type:complete len:265 (+) Transcript_79156:580-1374(+)
MGGTIPSAHHQVAHCGDSPHRARALASGVERAARPSVPDRERCSYHRLHGCAGDGSGRCGHLLDHGRVPRVAPGAHCPAAGLVFGEDDPRLHRAPREVHGAPRGGAEACAAGREPLGRGGGRRGARLGAGRGRRGPCCGPCGQHARPLGPARGGRRARRQRQEHAALGDRGRARAKGRGGESRKAPRLRPPAAPGDLRHRAGEHPLGKGRGSWRIAARSRGGRPHARPAAAGRWTGGGNRGARYLPLRRPEAAHFSGTNNVRHC